MHNVDGNTSDLTSAPNKRPVSGLKGNASPKDLLSNADALMRLPGWLRPVTDEMHEALMLRPVMLLGERWTWPTPRPLRRLIEDQPDTFVPYLEDRVA